MSKVNLGDRVRDLVSGKEGIATGITEWISGCDSVTVTPVAGADGGSGDGSWHADIVRIEVIERGAVKLDTSGSQNPKHKGGPRDHAAPSRAVSQR